LINIQDLNNLTSNSNTNTNSDNLNLRKDAVITPADDNPSTSPCAKDEASVNTHFLKESISKDKLSNTFSNYSNFDKLDSDNSKSKSLTETQSQSLSADSLFINKSNKSNSIKITINKEDNHNLHESFLNQTSK